MFFSTSKPSRKKKSEYRPNLTNKDIPEPKQIEYLSVEEIYTTNHTFIFDVEIYPNYFLVGFKSLEANKYIFFELWNESYYTNGVWMASAAWESLLGFMIHRFLIVGFNSDTYDLSIIKLALSGNSIEALKEANDAIILQNMRKHDVEREFGITKFNINHIDIMEVAPLHDGLKTYAGRIHCKRMQELPYSFNQILTENEVYYVRGYNTNDLDITGDLYNALAGQIRLREKLGEKYKLDLRSKSDAQVAEAVIECELRKEGIKVSRPNIIPGTLFKYQTPEFIKFKTPQLQEALKVIEAETFEINENGKADVPKNIQDLNISFNGLRFQMGNGGLHSTEQSTGYISNDKLLIVDRDVASYYPRIIINLELYPEHLGPKFVKVYKSLVDLRLEYKNKSKYYKEIGDVELELYWDEESSSLKISITGSFGKFGNIYSIFCSPKLVSQVTITGQLGLLMQIEMLSEANFKIISANTDGVVCLVPTDRKAEYNSILTEWESLTGFETEETLYNSLWSRDVNNYIAIKTDGKCKTKGSFSEKGSALNSILSKNPETYICSQSVQDFLAKGKSIKASVYECDDITKFISVRKVTGGAHKNGKFLGKVIRWYYAQDEKGIIETVKSGNKVPKSEGAKPLMDLPDQLPLDLDRDWYINEAEQMLYDLGYYHKPKVGVLI